MACLVQSVLFNTNDLLLIKIKEKSSKMKKMVMAVVIPALFLLAGCSQLNINITEQQINERLAEHFPLKKYFLVFELACTNPRIALSDDSDKVGVSIDAKIGVNLMNNIMPLGDGTIQVTSGLRFNPDTGELFLSGCQVDKLDINNIPAQYTSQITELTKFANTTLTGLLSQYPIYTLESKDRDVSTILGKFRLQEMKIQNGKLVLIMAR